MSLKVIKFSAVWCGPCKVLNPIWEELKATEVSAEFVSADIDVEVELLAEYKIKGVPTLLYLKDGLEVYRSVGLVTKDAIKAKLYELA